MRDYSRKHQDIDELKRKVQRCCWGYVKHYFVGVIVVILIWLSQSTTDIEQQIRLNRQFLNQQIEHPQPTPLW